MIERIESLKTETNWYRINLTYDPEDVGVHLTKSKISNSSRLIV
ncbi:hypothetical protein LSH36_60g06025 [Paralvinella palmiformis]|uniref:Uncharacterized protein n=1 Tax=Paralvinella palmiformis TaxID=53620 RepID=A0AAD9NC01_9ANNE|nr:hypothetical protein LSH36_60g06025 [Paralvinella palmiformis]